MSLSRRLLLNLLFLFSLPAFLSAQNYAWPTDASKNLTSAFAEFRPRHYHAALDIKTWNRTGYRVFAIDDGYIFRVRVSSFGYGRAVYQKLKDGRIVLYTHLERFTRKLQRYTDSLRLANQKYVLDKYLKPGQFPVKKGQLIAFSGDTGIGVPHLHFEMRDAQNRPINPLKFYTNRIRDTISPTLTRLAVIPRSTSTLINFEPDTLLLNLPARKTITIADPVYLTGNAYLALSAFDRADGVSNRFGLYKYEMYVNDSLAYAARFDRFSYAENPLIELDKNFSLKRWGKGVFQNLFLMPGNRLGFYGDFKIGSGLLSSRTLKTGRNEIIIRAADYFGNSAEISLPVIYYPPDKIDLYGISRLNGRILFNIKSKEPLHHIELSYQKPTEAGWETEIQYELKDVKKIFSAYHYFLSAPVDSLNPPGRVKVAPFKSESIPVTPAIIDLIPEDRSVRNVPPAIRFFGRQAALLWPFDDPDDVAKTIPVARRFQLPSGREYDLLAKTWQSDTAGEKSLQKNSLAAFLLKWKMIRPGARASVSSSDSVLRVNFSPNSVYDTLHSAVFTKSFIKTPQTGPSLLPVYDVQPFDQPLRQGAELQIKLPDRLKGLAGLDVYYLDRKKGWLFLPTELDSTQATYRAKILSLEKFTMFQDTVPPRIEPLNRSVAKILRPGQKSVRFRVLDDLSGIMKERQITVRIDGKWSLFKYDPEEDEVSIWPAYLPRGTHRIELRVIDNAGNIARLRIRYRK